MQKTLALLAGILISCILWEWKICVSYTLVMLFFGRTIRKSLWWEIPLGVFSCSVMLQLFPDSHIMLLRVFVVLAAVVNAYFSPRNMLLVFPLAVAAVYLKNIYAVSAMWAAVWCSVCSAANISVPQNEKSLQM